MSLRAVCIALCFAFIGVIFTLQPELLAVVGEAERFDEFEEAALEEFQEALYNEEKLTELDEEEDYLEILNMKNEQLKNEEDADIRKVLEEDLEALKSQLLQMPTRDKFQLEINGDYAYDSNISRQVPRSEKGDSVFNAGSTATFDLSGKKTDLRFELAAKRQWNIIFSEKDQLVLEERLRTRRKFFSRLNTSVNSRAARTNTKTIEIDNNKIRYDLNNQMSFNFPFSKKLSLNASFASVKRLFPQEAFDQDSGWQVTASPSAFWSITPKSRVSLGYSFGASRSRIKSGDTNSHDVNIGYFGKITRKSSASINLAYAKQVPRSTDTAESRTITIGAGTLWQMSPKTQISVQYIRALQNSTSELASGEVDGTNTVTRVDTHFKNENFSVSFNSRLKRKLSAVLTAAITHTRNKTFSDAVDDSVETRQFSFPLSAAVTYTVRKWMHLNFSYAFNFRTGNEKFDTSRAHTWRAAMRLIF